LKISGRRNKEIAKSQKAPPSAFLHKIKMGSTIIA
jgi:hypothetical protein